MWEGPSFLWAEDPGCTQKQVEQVMGSKPVRSIPPSSVLQLVSPRSFSDFLRYGLPWMFKWNKPISSPSCFWSVCSITSKGNLRQCGTTFKKNNGQKMYKMLILLWKSKRGWEDGSVSEMLPVQAWGPEVRSQTCTKNLGMARNTCDHSRSKGLLAS